MPLRPVSQLLSLTVPVAGKLSRQPLRHLSVTSEGSLFVTSNAYSPRPPRRMVAYTVVVAVSLYAVMGPSMP